MTFADELPPGAVRALHQQAVADFVAMVGTAVEAAESSVDIGEWIAENTQHWTREHARAGVLVLGMLITSSDIPSEALATVGRALIHTD